MSPEIDPRLVARIVTSYVRRHTIDIDALAALIGVVGQSLHDLARTAPPVEQPLNSSVTRRSLTRDVVVCLECGFRGRTLRRHIGAAHGLDPAAYRERWQLPADHPLTAPRYSAQRSKLAKRVGLGQWRRRKAVAAAPGYPPLPSGAAELKRPFPASLAVPRRRGRPRKQLVATA
jgi:predicted transcriptional regulator